MPDDWTPVRRLACALLALAALLARLAYYHVASHRAGEFPQCHDGSPILVGTHHKTGTVLLKHIFYKEVCPTMGWKCSFDNVPTHCDSPEEARAAGLQLCFLQHGIRFKVQNTREPYRFIHAIRDPTEVVLSGYQYHLTTTEKWANRVERRYNGTTYRKHLNSLPLLDGLRAEVKHSLRDALKTMPRLLNRTAARPCTLTLCLEELERNWGRTIGRMWDLLGLDAPTAAKLHRAVAKHNVYAAKKKAKFNRHVSNSSKRGALRSQLRALPDVDGKLRTVRKKLGYA